MESFELLPKSLHHGIRILLKNSFIHTEVTDNKEIQSSAAVRRRSAPPKLSDTPDEKVSSSSTTVMVRNIPSRFNQATLLECFGESINISAIDFFYLPIDFHTGKNLGYSFVNFSTSEAMTEFMSIFDGQRLKSNSHKLLSTTRAKIQGFDKNFRLFSASAVMTLALPHFRPMIKCLKCGRLCPLASSADDLDARVICKMCG